MTLTRKQGSFLVITPLSIEWQKVVFLSCLPSPVFMSSCPAKSRNKSKCQKFYKKADWTFRRSGGNWFDYWCGNLNISTKKYKIFYMKGTKFSFSIHWIGLHSQLESGVFLLKNKLLRNNKYPIFLSLKITFTLNDKMSFIPMFIRWERHHHSKYRLPSAP